MKQRMHLLFVVFVLGLVGITGSAQTPTGSVEGVITDQGKAVVAGAAVTLTSSATGQSFTATTNEEGFFTFRSLSPGVFSIRVEQKGFSSATAENIVVQVGQVARADISLKVGVPTETVQVSIGDTDLQVDTSRQTVDGVITGRQITALPLNTRNFLDLAVLEPSVVVADGGAIDPTKVNAYRAVRVNGGSGTGTRVQLEGIDVTDETVGTTTANFSTDAVQEFNLQRSSFDLGTSLTTSGVLALRLARVETGFQAAAFISNRTIVSTQGLRLKQPSLHLTAIRKATDSVGRSSRTACSFSRISRGLIKRISIPRRSVTFLILMRRERFR